MSHGVFISLQTGAYRQIHDRFATDLRRWLARGPRGLELQIEARTRDDAKIVAGLALKRDYGVASVIHLEERIGLYF